MVENLVIKIIDHFRSITGIDCKYQLFNKGREQHYTTLLKTEQGVYVFYSDNVCFKVGKAGSKSQARWNSHHYNLDIGTRSSMTKSINKDLIFFKSFFDQSMGAEIEELNSENIKIWIKNNVSRIEFKISSDESKFALSLLESLVQFYFNPIYEGKIRAISKINFI